MGIGQSHSSGLQNCLLSGDELRTLIIGDKFDHRNDHGRFIDYKSKKMFHIHYIGHPDKYGRWVDYKQNQFARYQSVSTRSATRLRNIHLNSFIAFKPRAVDPNCP